jgi:uncharacterized protein YndB with AHSA1/START domain
VKTSITFDFEFPHPIERVWARLADSATMAKWLMPNDFAPRLGHRFTFRREPMPQLGFDGITHCEVIELEAPTLLAFTFKGGPLDTIVRFRLEPTAKGTRMHFEHSGFDVDDPRQQFSFDAMSKGWAGLGKRFEELLAPEAASR